MKRFLFVCQGGFIRSVAMKYVFWGTVHEALSVGYDAVSHGTMEMLCEWADMVVLAEPSMMQEIPEEFQLKVWNAAVGPDVWGSKGLDEAMRAIGKKIKSQQFYIEAMALEEVGA